MPSRFHFRRRVKACPGRGWLPVLRRAVPALLAWLILAPAGFAVESPVPGWPPPPADPYVVYVRQISGPKDIGVKPPMLARFADWLTGVKQTQYNLDKPFGLSLDASGNLLVTDTGANAVYYLDLARKKWLAWKAVGRQSFASPVSAAHYAQTFFVADSALGKVIAFDARGRLQFQITNELERPTGLALLGDRLVIADSQRHQIVICGVNGRFLSKFGHRGTGPGEFNFPTHVCVDDRQRIYVTDSLNCRIQVFDAEGRFLREFGGAGDGPGRFSRPKGVALDTAGHVYVTDAIFDNIQIFDDTGRLLLGWGEGGTGPGQFWLPNAVAINSRNEIFVADVYNHRIQVFRYTGKL